VAAWVFQLTPTTIKSPAFAVEGKVALQLVAPAVSFEFAAP
jgi:hypothetical protein